MHTKEKIWKTDAGYPAVVMMIDMGHRCGYVGIPREHILYHKHYGKHVPELGPCWELAQQGSVGKRGIMSIFCAASGEVSADIVFDVHGSITYANGADWNRTYPIPNTNLWWLGYDCGHVGGGKDLSVLSPTMLEIERRHSTNGIVRSLEYCIGECESLAYQLKAAHEAYTRALFRKF